MEKMFPIIGQTCRCSRSKLAVVQVLLHLALLGPAVSQVYSGGFCLDNVTTILRRIGAAGMSSTTQAACLHRGYRWCPFDSSQTDVWQGETYYWFSPCCLGKQGQKMIPDGGPMGWPTCQADVDARNCVRWMWQDKWFNDYIAYTTSGYNYQVSPNNIKVNPNTYGGYPGKVTCLCNVTDPACTKAHNGRCILCQTDATCTNDRPVQFGLNFFKLHSVDLVTSLLSFAAWVRQEYYDSRLAYDHQCYGGADYFEVQAEAGNLENSLLWVPDVELYNNDEPIWKGSLKARHATVYSCSSPNRRDCGYVYYSRPGLVKALCKYEGFVTFPFDTASCELEFAAWGIDGRWQDIVPRAVDGGASWLGKPGTVSVVGLTAGSRYQDYTLLDVSVHRWITVFDCCPNAPYPVLIYKVRFQRSRDYYETQLMLPGILLVVLSWLTFYMDPVVGERLGYGMLVMLGTITNLVASSALMPRCDEKVYMQYINIVHMIFGAVALLETGAVLYLYHTDCKSWYEVLMPRPIRMLLAKGYYSLCYRDAEGHRTNRQSSQRVKRISLSAKKLKAFGHADDDEAAMLRKQMYRQVFYVLDSTHNMYLDLEEISEFGELITGGCFDRTAAMHFMLQNDEDFDGQLDLDEFVHFCDNHLVKSRDLFRFKQVMQGFLDVMDRKAKARVNMWQRRAVGIDRAARWVVPSGYILFLIVLWSKTAKELYDIRFDIGKQLPIFISGFIPMMVGAVIYFAWALIQCWMWRRATVMLKEERAQKAMANLVTRGTESGLSGDFRPQVSDDESGSVAKSARSDEPDVMQTLANTVANESSPENMCVPEEPAPVPPYHEISVSDQWVVIPRVPEVDQNSVHQVSPRTPPRSPPEL